MTYENFEQEKIIGLIINEPLILATFSPEEKTVDIFELPTNFYLEIGGKGFILASKVAELGSGRNETGERLLASSISSNFLIPIDFYLDFGNFSINRETIFEWREKILKPDSLFWFLQIPGKSSKILKTNFTLFDQLKLFWQLRDIRKDKFNYQIMPANNFEELILPNGDKVLKISQEGLAAQTLKKFSDLKIAQEGLTIAVYNAAGEPGLAQNVAKIFQNLGGQAFIGGESEFLSTSKILIKKDLGSTFTVKRLLKTFGGQIEKQTANELADIVILAGADLSERLFFNSSQYSSD